MSKTHLDADAPEHVDVIVARKIACRADLVSPDRAVDADALLALPPRVACGSCLRLLARHRDRLRAFATRLGVPYIEGSS